MKKKSIEPIPEKVPMWMMLEVKKEIKAAVKKKLTRRQIIRTMKKKFPKIQADQWPKILEVFYNSIFTMATPPVPASDLKLVAKDPQEGEEK